MIDIKKLILTDSYITEDNKHITEDLYFDLDRETTEKLYEKYDTIPRNEHMEEDSNYSHGEIDVTFYDGELHEVLLFTVYERGKLKELYNGDYININEEIDDGNIQYLKQLYKEVKEAKE